jgi:hypothetical protein
MRRKKIIDGFYVEIETQKKDWNKPAKLRVRIDFADILDRDPDRKTEEEIEAQAVAFAGRFINTLSKYGEVTPFDPKVEFEGEVTLTLSLNDNSNLDEVIQSVNASIAVMQSQLSRQRNEGRQQRRQENVNKIRDVLAEFKGRVIDDAMLDEVSKKIAKAMSRGRGAERE